MLVAASLKHDYARRWVQTRAENDPVANFVRKFNYETLAPVHLREQLPPGAEKTLHDAGVLPAEARLECLSYNGEFFARVVQVADENRVMEFEEKALIARIQHAKVHLRESLQTTERLLFEHPSHKTLIRWIARDAFTRLRQVIDDLDACIQSFEGDFIQEKFNK